MAYQGGRTSPFPSRASSPASVEAGLLALEEMLEDYHDGDDDDDDETCSETSETSNEDGINNVFLSGDFTGADKSTLQHEILSRARLESSQYGFHFDKHKPKGVDPKDVLDMNPKQKSAMDDFLTNPNGMNWEDLVESMKKKKMKKRKKKRHSRSQRKDGMALPTLDETSIVSDNSLPPMSESFQILAEEETVELSGQGQDIHEYDEETGEGFDDVNLELENLETFLHDETTDIDFHPTRLGDDNQLRDIDCIQTKSTRYVYRRGINRFASVFTIFIVMAALAFGAMLAIEHRSMSTLKMPSVPICLLIITGTRNRSEGFLDVFVDTGDGHIPLNTGKKYKKGQLVLDECYDELLGVQVTNQDKSAWEGSIKVSTDNKMSYMGMKCVDCTGKVNTTEHITVDGDHNDNGKAKCLNGIDGNVCNLVLAEDEPDVNEVEAKSLADKLGNGPKGFTTDADQDAAQQVHKKSSN